MIPSLQENGGGSRCAGQMKRAGRCSATSILKIGFEATGNYHRVLMYHLGVAGFDLKLVQQQGAVQYPPGKSVQAGARCSRFDFKVHRLPSVLMAKRRGIWPIRAARRGRFSGVQSTVHCNFEFSEKAHL